MTCPECARAAVALQAAQLDLSNAEMDLRACRRERSRLQTELKKTREESPERGDIERIFRQWVIASKRNPKRTKLTKDRFNAVRDRLREGYTVEHILDAVKGAATHPYRIYGSWRAQGPGSARADDLATICGTGRALDALAEKGREQTRVAYPTRGDNIDTGKWTPD